MGNKANASFRGDVDVVLTAVINNLDEEEYKQFLAYAEANGKLDASDYESRSKLIGDLAEFDLAEKEAIIKNLEQGKAAFD